MKLYCADITNSLQHLKFKRKQILHSNIKSDYVSKLFAVQLLKHVFHSLRQKFKIIIFVVIYSLLMEGHHKIQIKHKYVVIFCGKWGLDFLKKNLAKYLCTNPEKKGCLSIIFVLLL